MPQLYFTDLRALRRPAIVDSVSHELPFEIIATAATFGLVDGMPFILGDDGSYDHDLNRFFRACPTMGLRSLNSLRAYARDIVVWLRFLAERRAGKSIWAADRDDIAAFHEARRLSSPTHRISASSWNRSVAALDKLYRWAVEEKLIDKAPFTYRQVWTRALDGSTLSVSANMAREPAARNGDTRGLRLQEGSSLLAVELPSSSPQHHGQRSVAFRLASATAKGSKGRDIRLPLRLVKRLRDYIEVERSIATTRCRDRQSWMRLDNPIIVRGHDRQSLRIGEMNPPDRVRFDGIKPGERFRLLHEDTIEPLALWLTEGGLPMPMAAWEAVFRRASARCRNFGIDIDVTPHMLRHGFAVHMLTLLLREQIGWMLEERVGRMSPAYRRIIGDPLLKLQRLMGHSRIESTYIYLDHLDDSQALIDAAVEQWGLDVASVRDAA